METLKVVLHALLLFDVLFPLAMCILIYYVARIAFARDKFSTMLDDMAERADKDRSAYEAWDDRQPLIRKASFLISAIFLITAGFRFYVNVRPLTVDSKLNPGVKPYTAPKPYGAPGVGKAGTPAGDIPAGSAPDGNTAAQPR